MTMVQVEHRPPEHQRTTADRCIAASHYGLDCRRRATIYDARRGGQVCGLHANGSSMLRERLRRRIDELADEDLAAVERLTRPLGGGLRFGSDDQEDQGS